MVAAVSIPHDACLHCWNGASSHQPWHGTRGEFLKIGQEMTRRTQAREREVLAQLTDTELVGYGVRMRRMLATAKADAWDDFLIPLIEEWVEGAAVEWRWRKRAATLGADPVVRSAGNWPERIEQVKREVDLVLLIAYENGEIKQRGRNRVSCRCPFHADRHPSLDIDPDKGVWVCRACSVGGDAIRYVELRYGMAFPAAVGYLEERLGIPQPERKVYAFAVVRPT